MYFCKVSIHEKYMRRCLKLAKNGLGTTYPNPLVGSIIVFEDRIIGEGWHRKAGGPHAEVLAVESVIDKSLLKKSSLYVNLEPCSHFGKTPPCADMIVSLGIPKVIIGTVDPHTVVAGRGIAKLKGAGVEVVTDVLKSECAELNRRFFTFQQKKRPYIILKWAQSIDGFIAPDTNLNREPVWISNQYSRQLAHKWRTEEQAILAGTETVIKDNPKLNARDWNGNDPVRIVIDKSGRIPKESHIFDSHQRTIVFSETDLNDGRTEYEALDFTKDIIPQILESLYTKNIVSVLVEGGTKTLEGFISGGFWDEARVFTGNKGLGSGIKAPTIASGSDEKYSIAGDELKIFKNHDQHHYF